MVIKQSCCGIFILLVFLLVSTVSAEQAGSIRGVVYDADFDAPLAAAQILIAETGEKIIATDEGNFVFGQVEPGTYTLVFSKDGYTRQVKTNVVVSAGKMTEVDARLSGEFTEMEEFVVQDVQIGTGTEAALLELRVESPALMDSVGAELMSQAGASDAAGALRLVAGATVQDGKYAVVRGLPDRYVNSQMNGVRLPTADTDKRAVQLDQFPSAVIESIQVSKTFTPDQQGDASGGAVNIILKGIPDKRILKLESGISGNTQVAGNDNFRTYKGGGLDLFGFRDVDSPGSTISDGAIDTMSTNGPIDRKYSVTFGDKYQLSDDVRIGGLGSFFYNRDSSHYENGIDDKYWVEKPGEPMVPQYSKGGFPVNHPSWNPDNPDEAGLLTEEFSTTSLFDVIKSSQQVQEGAFGSVGLETDEHSLSFIYMYTHDAEDSVRIAEDTRGKEAYFPNGYSPDDPCHPGNASNSGRGVAPYLRSQTLTYTERTTETMQFGGKHEISLIPDISVGNFIKTLPPEFDWKISRSFAGLNQPDKRMFNSRWTPPYYVPGTPAGPYWDEIPPKIEDPVYNQFVDGSNINYGNFFRVWKQIGEVSDQYALNWKLPFEQWSGDEGYVKFGLFKESLSRTFDQDSYGNAQSGSIDHTGDWLNDSWARDYYKGDYMNLQSAKIKALDIDMDYDGRQDISASYFMVDLPLTSYLKWIGGYRYEKTELSIDTFPEEDVEWIVTKGDDGRFINSNEISKANVKFEQTDALPSIGFVLEPIKKKLTLRGTYSETIARQTFKELSAAPQQEYLGGDVFIGNPELQMSALENYDLRLDYTPYDGGLFSVSYFRKNITNPIEYIQGITDFSFTTPVNYPRGTINGYEFEVRQNLGHLWKSLEAFTLGGNLTLINSEVLLPKNEISIFEEMGFPIKTRNMMNAPEHLYNIFLNYDITPKTQLSFFYTVRGDMLVAGAGQSNGKFIPDVYETEYGTLNLGLSQKFWKTWNLKFQVKNLLNPRIESVYRSDYIGSDVTKTSYRKGIELGISISATF